MNKVYFAFGIHNHQPVGNFDFVFEDAYNNSYLPFLRILEQHPKIRIALHFTGILLDWIKVNHPELIDLVSKLVARNQIEMMTGGYYEPILSIIPEEDRVGQINKLSDEVNRLFGYRPHGMWLAERVWEPTLPSTLYQAHVKYTIADDTHFKYAGLTDNELNGYYITEDLGNAVALFPISKRLRYTIPFEDPQATIDYLSGFASGDGKSVIVFADDGEKFGVWPNTFKHVYEDGWLNHFFEKLEEHSDWIEMVHFSEALEISRPKGKIYLPTASYSEMMHWALFPATFRTFEDFEMYLKKQEFYDDVSVFVRGGFWRNFLSKYREVNNMHKKMLRVSRKLWSLPKAKRLKAEEAFNALWAGQCNCPYWHGVFGGLYLSHLRDAIYSNLIKAEIIADRLHGTDFPRMEVFDIDVDGYDEIVVETRSINAHIDTGRGGSVYELDFKPVAKNVLDTMTRHREGYHNKLEEAVVDDRNNGGDKTSSIHDLVLAKEPDLAAKLHYDTYERNTFIDHVLNADTTLEAFSASRHHEMADFINTPYVIEKHSVKDNRVTIRMTNTQPMWINDEKISLIIGKTFIFEDKTDVSRVNYILETDHKAPVDIWFGVELNFGMQAGHADDRYYYSPNVVFDDRYLDSVGILDRTNVIGIIDEWRNIKIELESDLPANIWRFPIETISLSEAGFERVYQNSVLLPNWKIRLDKKAEIKLKLKLSKYKS